MEDSVTLPRELAEAIFDLAKRGVDDLYEASREDEETDPDDYTSAWETWITFREILFPNN